MSESFHNAQDNLNERFFAEIDKQLLADLREDLQHEQESRVLAAATGLVDTELLEELVALKVSPETLAAFRLVPMVAVGWSDRKIERAERDVLMDAAAREGIKRGAPAWRLLEQWLERQPSPQLLHAWTEYTEEICKSLSSSAIKVLKAEVIGQAEMVAQAAGGLLGLGAVSKAEKETLAVIRNAFPNH